MPRWSAFYSQVASIVQAELRQSGYEMIVSDMSPQGDGASTLPVLPHWPVDGVLTINAQESVISACVEASSSHTVPLVSMGLFRPAEIDHVAVDTYAGALQAVEHLVSAGCRRVAFLVVEEALTARERRCTAYEQAVSKSGLADEYIVTEDHSRASARQNLIEYIHRAGCPDGIFCYDDDLAIGAHRGLGELGIGMPDDVSVVGYDGVDETAYLTPSLSTVAQPVSQMCSVAWQLLQQRIDDPSGPVQHRVLQPQLIVRDSSQRK